MGRTKRRSYGANRSPSRPAFDPGKSHRTCRWAIACLSAKQNAGGTGQDNPVAHPAHGNRQCRLYVQNTWRCEPVHRVVNCKPARQTAFSLIILQCFACDPSSAWTDQIGSKSKALRRGVLEFEAVFEIFIVPANNVMIDTDFLRLGSQGVRPHKWRKKRLVFR